MFVTIIKFKTSEATDEIYAQSFLRRTVQENRFVTANLKIKLDSNKGKGQTIAAYLAHFYVLIKYFLSFSTFIAID